MDGKGRWRDNVFVERFWRLLKYEQVYLQPTSQSAMPGLESAAVSGSSTSNAHTQASIGKHPIRYTSTACWKPWQPEPVTARP
jgi:hypothetical protein